jgi:geranylgeranyl pyrophosphate synthase
VYSPAIRGDSLYAALPAGVVGGIEEVEERLAGVAKRAPSELIAPSLEALTSGGKRLRPMLLMLSGNMGKPGRDALLEAATAVEVLHTATLVHDDVVDRAENRRGQQTTVAAYGRTAAVAVGDYLFSEAFSLLARIGEPRIVRCFSKASRGLAAGELEQYRAAGVPVGVEEYMSHIRMKTAGLFEASCVAGGILGGLSLAQNDALAGYGQALGLAFQMSDDVMDVVGEPGVMGKGAGTDLAEGTVTLPIILALRDGASDTIEQVLAHPSPGHDMIESAICAILDTDAVERTEEWTEGEVRAAAEGIKILPECRERRVLEAIAGEMVGRSS